MKQLRLFTEEQMAQPKPKHVDSMVGGRGFGKKYCIYCEEHQLINGYDDCSECGAFYFDGTYEK